MVFLLEEEIGDELALDEEDELTPEDDEGEEEDIFDEDK